MTATRRQIATVVPFPKSPVPPNAPDIIQSLRQCMVEVIASLQKLSFGSLQDGERAGHHDMVTATFVTPKTSNAEFVVYHALGRRPKGRMIADQDGLGHLWSVKKKWTDESVVFVCDRANVEFTVVLL